MPMPVPASYNDITEDNYLRDHVGTVWYDRRFYIPASWENNRRVWIRFGSVHYEAFVVRKSQICNYVCMYKMFNIYKSILYFIHLHFHTSGPQNAAQNNRNKFMYSF